jgi:hypothetical protein
MCLGEVVKCLSLSLIVNSNSFFPNFELWAIVCNSGLVLKFLILAKAVDTVLARYMNLQNVAKTTTTEVIFVLTKKELPPPLINRINHTHMLTFYCPPLSN